MCTTRLLYEFKTTLLSSDQVVKSISSLERCDKFLLTLGKVCFYPARHNLGGNPIMALWVLADNAAESDHSNVSNLLQAGCQLLTGSQVRFWFKDE